MSTSGQGSRRTALIILIALCIHLLLLVVLLIPDFQNNFIITPELQGSDTPVIFDSPSSSTTPPSPAPSLSHEDWGNMTAAPSTFGIPPDEESDTVSPPAPIPHTEQNADDETDPTDSDSETSQEVPLPSPSEQNTKMAPTQFIDDPSIAPPASNRKGRTRKSLLQAIPLSEEQKKIAQQLAQLKEGYIQQTKTMGTHLITMVGGDPSKMATADQIKYSRYAAKMQWSLQQSFYGNGHKFKYTKPIMSTIRVFCSLARNGSLQEVQLLNGSGNAAFDQYVKYVFAQAALSFPPVPGFIKEEPYNTIWLIDVNVHGPIGWPPY